MALFLGLDAGITSVKAGLFNSSGHATVIGRVEYYLETPVADWVELNPDVYWNACARAIRTVLDLSKIDPGEICALAISSQGETGHFVQAIMEAVAFMLRRNLDLILASGFHAEEIRNSGGGARSSLWNQIKADVCGLPIITLASEKAALLGDAILASVAVGEFGSLQQACEQMVALKGRIEPGVNQSVYSHYYQLYCKLDNYMDAFSRVN